MTEAAAPIERVRPDPRRPKLRTGSGRIYPYYSTFRRWLGEGGFEDVRRRDLPGPFPLTLITGERR